jgi:hypothetical protein
MVNEQPVSFGRNADNDNNNEKDNCTILINMITGNEMIGNRNASSTIHAPTAGSCRAAAPQPSHGWAPGPERPTKPTEGGASDIDKLGMSKLPD